MKTPSTADSREPSGLPVDSASDPAVARRRTTHANVKGEAVPRLPHERDESSDSGGSGTDPLMRQAAEDIESGKRPTDRSEATDALYGRTLRGERGNAGPALIPRSRGRAAGPAGSAADGSQRRVSWWSWGQWKSGTACLFMPRLPSRRLQPIPPRIASAAGADRHRKEARFSDVMNVADRPEAVPRQYRDQTFTSPTRRPKAARRESAVPHRPEVGTMYGTRFIAASQRRR